MSYKLKYYWLVFLWCVQWPYYEIRYRLRNHSDSSAITVVLATVVNALIGSVPMNLSTPVFNSLHW